MQIVVVTADFIGGGNECASNYEIVIVLPDQVQMTWTPAIEGNGTKIIATYGDDPDDCNDGITVYLGNGSSTTHVVDPDAFAVGIYYRVYTLLEGGNCSSCFASGTVISQLLETGAGSTIDMTGVDSGLLAIADYIKTGLMLAFPFLLGLVGGIRHSLTGYLAGIIGFSIALATFHDNFGLAITAPAGLIIFGLGAALVYDVWWGDGLRIV